MKLFHCRCGQVVYFENTSCLTCGRAVAYLPDREEMTSWEQGADGLWRTGTACAGYRPCANRRDHDVCNWVVAADDPNPYCLSCRLTRVIPDLNRPGNKVAWVRLESSKRRMLSTLLTLDLPVVGKQADPVNGLAFEFLADPVDGSAPRVLTGHSDGLITVNLAEADDVERERRRAALNEPYRTLLGHFRHEVGHYYWDRLVRDSAALDGFRGVFGDERADYAAALKIHHEKGAPPHWQASFVSTYASAHPWEDWAETWAHYLHITDTLETAVASGMALHPKRPDEPSLRPDLAVVGPHAESFDVLIAGWLSLIFILNNLNRGMGLADAYPFVLSVPALEKLRFVHGVIADAATAPCGTRAGVLHPTS